MGHDHDLPETFTVAVPTEAAHRRLGTNGTYDEHLAVLQDLVEDAHAAGHNVLLCPLDVDEYEAWCAATDNTPGTAQSFARYAAASPEKHDFGGDVWRYASLCTAHELLGDITEDQHDRYLATHSALFDTITDHFFAADTRITVATGEGGAVATTTLDGGQVTINDAELEVVSSWALVALHRGGGLTLRTTTETGVEVRGWVLGDGAAHQLTEAELFAAYCTDAETGDPIPPEHGVTYIGADTPAASAPASARRGPKVGRNEPCPCGSGVKHKRCCT